MFVNQSVPSSFFAPPPPPHTHTHTHLHIQSLPLPPPPWPILGPPSVLKKTRTSPGPFVLDKDAGSESGLSECQQHSAGALAVLRWWPAWRGASAWLRPGHPEGRLPLLTCAVTVKWRWTPDHRYYYTASSAASGRTPVGPADSGPWPARCAWSACCPPLEDGERETLLLNVHWGEKAN